MAGGVASPRKALNERGNDIMKEKKYLVKVAFSDGAIFYIAHLFGGYYVMATDAERTFSYSSYGSYRRIGDASRRLAKSSKGFKTAENSATMYYATKSTLDEFGAFCDEE